VSCVQFLWVYFAKKSISFVSCNKKFESKMERFRKFCLLSIVLFFY
jgi:hypothetical protein